MKAIIALAAAALACAVGAGAAPRVVLTHYHWTGSDVFDGISRALAEKFMARNPGVEVKMIFLPDDTRAGVIRSVLASGRPIDTFGLTNGESAEFLAAQQMTPIDPAAFGKSAVEGVAEMWMPGAFEACGGTWQGQYYGIPFELSNYVAWVRASDMQEAGLDPSRDLPRTWEQFANVARKLTKIHAGTTQRNGFMCNSKAGVFNYLVLLAMMEQLGLDWGSERGLLASMDQPQVLARGLRTYTDLVTVSRVWDPAFHDEDRGGFAHNKTAMFLTAGSWYWGLLKAFQTPPSDVVPFPYPRFPGGRDIGGVGYGYSVFVARHSANPTLAFRLLDALTSNPNELIRYGYLQPRLALSSGEPALDPNLARKAIPYYEQVFRPELGKTAVWLHSTKGDQVIAAVWGAITRVIYQGMSVDDSVAALRTDIRAIIPAK